MKKRLEILNTIGLCSCRRISISFSFFILASLLYLPTFTYADQPTLGSVIVNEWSQGNASTQEWVELLVIGTITDTLVDLRGCYLGDTENTPPSIHGLQFSSNSIWAAVKRGSIIVIYNGLNKDASLPSDDLVFGSDNRVVIPHSNTTYFSVTGTFAWASNLNLFTNNNANDNPAVYKSDGTLIFSWNTQGPGASVHPGTSQLTYYTSYYGNYTNSDNWAVSSSVLGSAGAPNGGDNHIFIEGMRANTPSIKMIPPNSPALAEAGTQLQFIIKLGSEIPAYDVQKVSFKFRRGYQNYFRVNPSFYNNPYVTGFNLFGDNTIPGQNGSASIDTTSEPGIVIYSTTKTGGSLGNNGFGGSVTRLTLDIIRTIANASVVNFYLSDVYAELTGGRVVNLVQFTQQYFITFVTSVGGTIIYKIGKGDSNHDGKVNVDDVFRLATHFSKQGGAYGRTWQACTTVVRDPWGIDGNNTDNLAMWCDHNGDGRVENLDVLAIGYCYSGENVIYNYGGLIKNLPHEYPISKSRLRVRLFDKNNNQVETLTQGEIYQMVLSIGKPVDVMGISFLMNWLDDSQIISYELSEAFAQFTSEILELVKISNQNKNALVVLARPAVCNTITSNSEIELIRFNVKFGSSVNNFNFKEIYAVNSKEEKSALPLEKVSINLSKKFELSQNYPNPFNPSTSIEFSLAEPSKVNLKIYNSLGQLITTLISDEYLEAGTYKKIFDVTKNAAENNKVLNSGVYFYEISSDKFTDRKKMILVK